MYWVVLFSYVELKLIFIAPVVLLLMVGAMIALLSCASIVAGAAAAVTEEGVVEGGAISPSVL